MFDYWPLFALGLICGALVLRAWTVMTAPLPPARDPRTAWADYHRKAEEARKRAGGAK